jgi:hypothetical protein
MPRAPTQCGTGSAPLQRTAAALGTALSLLVLNCPSNASNPRTDPADHSNSLGLASGARSAQRTANAGKGPLSCSRRMLAPLGSA